jgi:hypothetical protein
MENGMTTHQYSEELWGYVQCKVNGAGEEVVHSTWGSKEMFHR